MLRPTVQLPSLSWNKAPHLELTTRFLLLSDSCGFLDVERSLWREDGSVVYNCCWSLPAQSFSGPSPVRFVTLFYCLRFNTSLFFASYDSRGYGGSIRARLHMGYCRFSAELLFITISHWPNRKHLSQRFLFCYLRIRCSGNLFNEPLSSKGHLLWLHYSSLQTSCHDTYRQ
jgi:hypothetical protein